MSSDASDGAVTVRTGCAVGLEMSIPTAFTCHPNAKLLISTSHLCMLGHIPAYLIAPLPPPHCPLASPSFPLHLDSHSQLDLECLIAPHFTKQPRPSDHPSRWPTPLVCAAPKKLPTDTVLIAHSPLQVGHQSGLVLLQLSQSLSENQHNMMSKFCKMMKIFV